MLGQSLVFLSHLHLLLLFHRELNHKLTVHFLASLLYVLDMVLKLDEVAVHSVRVQITAVDISSARTFRTRATKDEELLHTLVIANGAGPAWLGAPAALSYRNPFALRQVKHHDVVEARVRHFVINDLINRPVTLIHDRLRLLGRRRVLERNVIFAAIYEQVFIVLDKDRRVISTRQWTHACLSFNLSDRHFFFARFSCMWP